MKVYTTKKPDNLTFLYGTTSSRLACGTLLWATLRRRMQSHRGSLLYKEACFLTAENQRLRISSSDQEDALKKCSRES